MGFEYSARVPAPSARRTTASRGCAHSRRGHGSGSMPAEDEPGAWSSVVVPTLSVYRNGTLEWQGPVTENTLRIGRSPENDLALQDPAKGFSRFHAELRWEHDHSSSRTSVRSRAGSPGRAREGRPRRRCRTHRGSSPGGHDAPAALSIRPVAATRRATLATCCGCHRRSGARGGGTRPNSRGQGRRALSRCSSTFSTAVTACIGSSASASRRGARSMPTFFGHMAATLKVAPGAH